MEVGAVGIQSPRLPLGRERAPGRLENTAPQGAGPEQDTWRQTGQGRGKQEAWFLETKVVKCGGGKRTEQPMQQREDSED